MIEFLQTWSYVASYLGTLIEGEILLLTAIITAKLGYMNFYGAMIAAFFGAYTRDWLTFLLARKSGRKIVAKKPSLKRKIEKVNGMMEKNPLLILTIYRFMYGFVTIIVLMVGMSDISMRKFGVFSALSNLLWVTMLGGLGFFFAETMIELISQYKGFVIGILTAIGLLYWFFIKRKEMEEDGNLLTENSNQ